MASVKNSKQIALFGSAALAIGSLLDWATVSSVFGELSVAGTKGDGKLTLAAGLIALILFIQPTRQKAMVGAIISLLGALISIYDFANVSSHVADVDSSIATADVGIGLYLCAIGSVAASVAGFVLAKAIAEQVPDAA